ncbi:unnamed protein product [Mytilus coruscus]|uniref:CCHC-type domain-containing protein n=1 Tax=Mytilus coruscus TaxID=42192 RepID=A0A6J8E5Y2_MYTCO|nr:unnamed protein product [Mytilus coruscus]
MDADIKEIIQAEVQSAILGTQDKLLNSLTSLLDTRLNGFQQNIQDSQKALSESQLAKIGETITETFKFRKRGNEEQYKHNKKVFVKVLEANSQLESENLNNDNIQTAKRKIYEDRSKANTKTKQLAPENPIPVNTNKMFRPGRCFSCSETGHWRRECPHATVQHTNKISTNMFLRNVSRSSSTSLYTKQTLRNTTSLAIHILRLIVIVFTQVYHL